MLELLIHKSAFPLIDTHEQLKTRNHIIYLPFCAQHLAQC